MWLQYPETGSGSINMTSDDVTPDVGLVSAMTARLHGDVTPPNNVAHHAEPNTSAILDNTLSVNNELRFYNFVLNVYVDGLLCVLGYIGNVMTFAVLQKDRVRTSNTILLQALAVFDSMFLTYVVLYVVLRSIAPYTGQLEAYAAINPYIVAIVLPFGWTSQTCTIWIVMTIAIDRYLVVSRPLRAQLWCTPTKARWVVLCVFVAALLFNAPRWPHYYFIAFQGGGNSSSSTTQLVSHIATHQSMFWDDNLYRTIYHQSLGFILLFVIPLIVIITLNILLVMTIKRAVKAREALTNRVRSSKVSHGESSNLNLNIMLVIMITIFVVCELPDFVASVIGVLNTEVDEVIYAYYAAIKECLLVINSTVNFFIYCIFYTRFRATLASMLGCGGTKDKTPPGAEKRAVNGERQSISSQNGGRGHSGSDIRSVGSQQTLNSSLNGSLPQLSTSLSNISLSPRYLPTEDLKTKL